MQTSSKLRLVLSSVSLLVILAVLFSWYGPGSPTVPDTSLPLDSLAQTVDRGLSDEARTVLEARVDELHAQIADAPARDISLFLLLGNVYYSLGELRQAVAAYDDILSTHPSDAPALENKGQAIYEMGDPNGAIALWHKALETSPYEVTYLKIAMAIELHAPERRTEIKPLLEDAIATMGQTPGLLLALGRWYEAEGDYDRAISHYEIALALAPGSGDIEQAITDARAARAAAEGL